MPEAGPAVLFAALICACAEPPPSSGAVPRALTAAAPTTAMLAVRLGREGRVSLGAVVPKPTRWADPLTPFDPLRHAPSAPAPALSGGREAVVVAIVAEVPGETPVVSQVLLDPPGMSRGDVVDPWTAGGALWRAPYLGPGTRYRVVRLSPAPGLLATWP